MKERTYANESLLLYCCRSRSCSADPTEVSCANTLSLYSLCGLPAGRHLVSDRRCARSMAMEFLCGGRTHAGAWKFPQSVQRWMEFCGRRWLQFHATNGVRHRIYEFGPGRTDANLQQNQAVDGDAFVYGVTLDPIWRFRIAGPVGGYLIGGGGFYETDTRYTEQAQVFVPTFHGGFFAPGLINVHQIDDTGGVNAGPDSPAISGSGNQIICRSAVPLHFHLGSSGTQILPVTIGFRW